MTGTSAEDLAWTHEKCLAEPCVTHFDRDDVRASRDFMQELDGLNYAESTTNGRLLMLKKALALAKEYGSRGKYLAERSTVGPTFKDRC